MDALESFFLPFTLWEFFEALAEVATHTAMVSLIPFEVGVPSRFYYDQGRYTAWYLWEEGEE